MYFWLQNRPKVHKTKKSRVPTDGWGSRFLRCGDVVELTASIPYPTTGRRHKKMSTKYFESFRCEFKPFGHFNLPY